MFILITGGCKNGKSSIAEKILSSYDVKKYYIATMEPFGEEASEAIERHRKMRSGKGFETIEKYTAVNEIVPDKKSGMLLECICNLCANEMFSANVREADKKIAEDIKELLSRTEIFIAVTNQVGSDGIEYLPETMEYITRMGSLNSKLAMLADIVIEAVFGIPVALKGELPSCLC